MKFYTSVKSCDIVEKDDYCYFKIGNAQRGDILAFPSKERKEKIIDSMKNGDWKNAITEVNVYSYKAKSGDYKTCFIITDVIPGNIFGE